MTAVTFSIKKSFFDRAAVVAAIGRARSKALSRAGAYVRRTARTKLRKRKKASAPGQPPSIHGPEPGLKTILFAWEGNRESMIIGPVKLNGSMYVGDGTLPALLETGGLSTRYEKRWAESRRKKPGDDQWWAMGKRARKKPRDTKAFEYRTRVIKIAPRPFMAPAIAENREKFPDLFRNAIKG